MSKVFKALGQISSIFSAVAAFTGNPVLAGAFAAQHSNMGTLIEATETRQEISPMTAIQLFMHDGDAYLVADGAGIDPEGRVIALGSKISVTSDMRMALAFSGYGGANEVQEALALRVPHGTPQDRLNALPDVVAYLSGQAALANPEMHQRGLTGVTIFAATYLEDGPRCHIVTTEASHGIPTMQLVEVEGRMIPPVDVAAVLPFGGVTNPRLDAIALLNAQRRVTNEHFGGGSTVGGKCIMARVTFDGVEIIDLIEWPDKIGERIPLA